MKLATVIPIAKGIFAEDLTYYTSRDIIPGALVTVPVRNKTVTALVVETKALEDNKINIKQATFGLKPIKKIIADSFFTPEFVDAARDCGTYYACTLGQVIKSFTPKLLTEGAATNEPLKPQNTFGAFEEVAIQASPDERFGFYKSFIREEFAKKRSVFFILPTVADVTRVAPLLLRGIEEYSFILHGDLTPTTIIKTWKRALTEEHPVLIITTPSYLSLPRRDFGAIIVEREASSHWKNPARPFLDGRAFARALAARSKTRILWGDIALRSETLHRSEKDSFVTLLPTKFRSLSQATCTLSDMRPVPHTADGFIASVGPELFNAITNSFASGSRAILYVHRKGVAPSTVCQDCGTIVTCTRCSAPVVLHESPEGTFYLCHKCWLERASDTVCSVCGGWRLKTLGLGIERIRDDLAHYFPNAQIFSLDSDSVTTNKKAQEVIDEFYAAPHAILVGTDMMLPYLREQVHTTAAVTIDSLFAIPDFRMNEKVFHTLLILRSLAERNFIIQTRNPERKLLTYAVYGTLMDFYREEAAARQKLKYPPFSVLVKITREGKEADIERDMAGLHGVLKEWNPLVFPSFTKSSKGQDRLHALMKIDPTEWPHKKITNILTSLPPQFVVHVDPEDIL